MPGVRRSPYLGKIVPFVLPSTLDEDPELQVVVELKKFTLKDRLELEDAASTMRFIERAGQKGSGPEYVTERDVPMGTTKLARVKAGIHAWNISDQDGNPVKITEKHIQDYLEPSDFDAVLDEVNKLNSGESADELKNA